MALSSCFFASQICLSLKNDSRTRLLLCNNAISQRCMFSLESSKTMLFGSRVIGTTEPGRNSFCRKKPVISASWLTSTQIATSAFTWGTVAVLPVYTFMVVAPQAEFTKKVAGSSIPYIVLGVLYAYILYLSWTPDTLRLMFASKYWLPELQGIAKMFSSEMTLASAWIHLLAVDLFAARQVYFDGVRDKVETRHSVSLCLLFCPIGILIHFITKAAATSREKTEHGIH